MNVLLGFLDLKIRIEKGYKIRFRCHATHSFSGLGKSFEEIF